MSSCKENCLCLWLTREWVVKRISLPQSVRGDIAQEGGATYEPRYSIGIHNLALEQKVVGCTPKGETLKTHTWSTDDVSFGKKSAIFEAPPTLMRDHFRSPISPRPR